ncbi:MAG: HDOD domain-containing protein [Desulforegulaceae bacterium]|nr:HDOD domain-containing protein [Desulforegulaceae bacterium]
MESVLIASKETKELEIINNVLKKHYKSILITSSDMMKKNHTNFDIMLLDHNFTEHSAIDFLMDINIHKSVPVLFLTPDNDPQCAVEALRAGAFNYIVKAGNYISILNIAIKDAINKFQERKTLKEKINELQDKIIELQDKYEKNNRAQTIADTNENKIEPAKKELSLVEEIISRFKKGEINLPALPQINIEFKKLISKGANINELASLLKQDIAISSTLINISNSALYKGVEENKTLENAISRLGLSTTRQYVEVISNRSLYTAKNKKYFALMEKLWMHSLSCAYASELIANTLNLKTDNDTFTLGLIHDIGKLVLLQIIGELEIKGKFTQTLTDQGLNETLKNYHGKFGAVLLKRWSFPEEFIQVSMYHDSIEEIKNPSTDFLIVHFANLLVNSIGFSMYEQEFIDLENSRSCYELRLRTSEIEDLKIKVMEYMGVFKNVL